MAGVPAYRYNDYERSPRRVPEQAPRIQVVPGRGNATETALSPALITAAKIVGCALIVIAILGFVRIGLASATVTTALSTQELSTQIETVRSQSNELEVQQSYLSNPTHIKTVAASRLGMGEADNSVNLVLDKDIVSADSQGNLSLALSIKAATQG